MLNETAVRAVLWDRGNIHKSNLIYRQVNMPWSILTPIIEVAFIFSFINARLSMIMDMPPKEVRKPQNNSLW